VKRAMGRICALALAVSMVGCTSYTIRSATNVYYSNRAVYHARCEVPVVTGAALERCRNWQAVGNQTQLSIKDAAQAHGRGGSAKPQISALKRLIAALKKFEAAS
jgi:hypothetical protein